MHYALSCLCLVLTLLMNGHLPKREKLDDDELWLIKWCYLALQTFIGGKIGQWEMVSDITRPPQLVMRYHDNQEGQYMSIRMPFVPKYRNADGLYGCWIRDRNTGAFLTTLSALHCMETHTKPIDNHHMTVACMLHQSWSTKWLLDIWRSIMPNMVTVWGKISPTSGMWIFVSQFCRSALDSAVDPVQNQSWD